MSERQYIVERIGSNAYNQHGCSRAIIGTITARTIKAAGAKCYASLPGTMYATTALDLDDGRTEHCYNNQHFEFRSLLRARREDRIQALTAD